MASSGLAREFVWIKTNTAGIVTFPYRPFVYDQPRITLRQQTLMPGAQYPTCEVNLLTDLPTNAKLYRLTIPTAQWDITTTAQVRLYVPAE